MSGKVFVVAEIGSVHDGSFGNAAKLVEAAAKAGADAVKFQTHIAAAETLRDAPMPPYFRGEPRYAYFERTAFTRGQWRELRDRCRDCGVEFLSSPFSIEAVDLLEEVGVARYKIASGEVTNLPLLERVAAAGKPVLLSSGMSDWEELDAAVAVLRGSPLTVLQCASQYPCPDERVGLNVLAEMRERYRVPVGLSDHTLANHAAFAAVALGACVVEKHFTFSRLMYGSDAPHSAEPAEFAELVRGIRAIEAMLAHPVDKADAAPWAEMKRVFQKSLVSLADIPRGARLSPSTVGIKKPGTGLPPSRYRAAMGRRAARDIPADRVIVEEDVDWGSDA